MFYTYISLLSENADVYAEFDFENKYLYRNFDVHPLQDCKSMSVHIFSYFPPPA